MKNINVKLVAPIGEWRGGKEVVIGGKVVLVPLTHDVALGLKTGALEEVSTEVKSKLIDSYQGNDIPDEVIDGDKEVVVTKKSIKNGGSTKQRTARTD